DTDFNQSTGYYVGGSETCIVIVGKVNRLISSTIYRYDGAVWVNNGPVDAAIDSYQLEVGSSFESLGISPEGTYVVTFLAQDWRGCSDDMLAFLSTRAVSGVREFGGIIINEVYSTIPGRPLDWFELYNTGPDTIDLSGWELWVNGVLLYTFPDGFTLDSGEIWLSPYLSFVRGVTFELLDDSGVTIDSVTLPVWQAKSYGVIGTPEDEYADWDWMDSTPGEINIGQVPIPEFESVVMPLAIVTIMFFAIRRKRRERTTEENREGESDDGHE
ncbi:MAG: lamin tail domain-containing protein, partial [Thermoplasmata archaeon]